MRENEFIKFTRISLEEGEKNFFVNRKELIDRMEEIKIMYEGNNEFAKKFVKILPDTKIITIDIDRNRDRDVPFITCATLDKRPAEVILIPRCNKVIWSTFYEFMKN